MSGVGETAFHSYLFLMYFRGKRVGPPRGVISRLLIWFPFYRMWEGSAFGSAIKIPSIFFKVRAVPPAHYSFKEGSKNKVVACESLGE